MAKLTAKKRRKLPASAYAYPKQRRYPIHDRPHRRAALSMAARKDTFGSYSHVKKRIAQKVGASSKNSGTRGRRTQRRHTRR